MHGIFNKSIKTEKILHEVYAPEEKKKQEKPSGPIRKAVYIRTYEMNGSHSNKRQKQIHFSQRLTPELEPNDFPAIYHSVNTFLIFHSCQASYGLQLYIV